MQAGCHARSSPASWPGWAPRRAARRTQLRWALAVGSELLTTGSVVAAFLAGGVALFAPCCIVFLAPSYLAGAVKNRRWRLLPLTFVFAAGLGVVLLPLTLGASLLAGAIARYHQPLYYIGGALMIGLAVLVLVLVGVSTGVFLRLASVRWGWMSWAPRNL